MAAEPQRNSFRAAVLNGVKPDLVVSEKSPRLDHSTDDLDRGIVPRSETRRGNHRGGDRHRLSNETALARYEGEDHRVELVNLSAGGAMIRADFEPRLWDMVELELAEGQVVECAVRWLKNGLVGLEFAHETRIDCAPETRARLLLDVISRSFPDASLTIAEPEGEDQASEVEAGEESDCGKRLDKRHPLIWNGEIHDINGSNPVRLRNISTGGALVDVAIDYAVGSEVLLDLGEAGQFFAFVTWAHGDQVGLKFKEPFDIECLAKSRPEVAPTRWVKPSFLDLRETDDLSPWHSKWSRSSLSEIRTELEGFLKR